MKAVFIISGLLVAGFGTLSTLSGDLCERDEFKITSAHYSMSLRPGETRVVILKITRSARFAHEPIRLACPVLPDKVHVEFEPQPATDSLALIVSGESTIARWPEAAVIICLNVNPTDAN